MSIDLDNPASNVETREAIPLFPLPNAVLFPNTTIQLHVFEQRYRSMTRDVLDEDLPIAVGLIVGSGRATSFGQPEVYPVCGIGRVTDYEKLDDGGYNIYLRGTSRASIVDELEVETPYRQARVERLDDSIRHEEQAAHLVKTIQNCMFNVQAESEDVTRALTNSFRELDDPGAIADVIGAIVFTDTRQRQEMLAQTDVIRRLEGIRDRLAEMIISAFQQSEQRDQVVLN